ncbi:sensor histidine kinase [Flavobacterium sp.]|uniref:sensor histidine kinase n=1 Tax=Flavobacterium sp. TaxID=239 RepID=UPI002604B6ED|nr:sensor histidine kinase [Flavobacterium sp.]
MTKLPFIVSARAGKLLGRENFSNADGAIIELVKNAYDADAYKCIVIFDIPTILKDKTKETIPDRENSSIYIIDNGDGMTKDIIEQQWMKIGTGNKETSAISTEKRVKTGAKGIGRFALDRLGYAAEMWTLPRESKNNEGFNWIMDWTQFDNSDKSISEITADLTLVKVEIDEILDKYTTLKQIKDFEFKNGTILKISKLKDDWYQPEIEGIFKNLEALIPPKELKIPFQVLFLHAQNLNEYGQVETAFFNDFDYKLTAEYNADNLNVDFVLTRNELDIKKLKKDYDFLYKTAKAPYDLKTIEEKTFKYSKSINSLLKWELTEENKKLLKEVGSFNLTFYYLKYVVSQKEDYPYRSINSKERRTVLDKFGGVKIYRDSFRVRPYGDPANDWLRLGVRVAQSPAGAGQRIGDWRVRPEQTAGIITISRQTNPKLIDKSDRGALQENDAFETFKNIIVAVIHEFEVDRSKILNVLYKHAVVEKQRLQDLLIQSKAEELADKIVAERKQVEEKIFGQKANTSNLFEQHKEEEEKKAYQDAFKETFNAIEDERLEANFEEIVQIRGLASLGLIVSSFSHELREIRNNATEIKSLTEIYKSLIIRNSKNKEDYDDGIDILELLNDNTDKIKHWVDYSLSAIKKDKRKRGNFLFSPYLKELNKTWKKIFKSKDITLEVDDNLSNLDYSFRAFEMDFDTIFTNLINNSIDSLTSLDVIQHRIIKISVQAINNDIEILYSDNGKGLSNVFTNKEDIFLPFTTSKIDRHGKEIGTGLGMYLVKSVVDDNNGDIEILTPSQGFAVKITFPIRKL